MEEDSRLPRPNRYSKKLEQKIAKITNMKSRKWSETEIQTLLECIQKHGHMAFPQLEECLPEKKLDAIKSYLVAAKSKSKELPSSTTRELDKWLNSCNNINKKRNYKKWEDSIQTAQVIKYLSVDGLIESHPLPENCNNIDFPSAYRLLYQALMGHPLQPVNKATADFVTETMGAIIADVTKEMEIKRTFNKVVSHLKENFNGDNVIKDEVLATSSEPAPEIHFQNFDTKKPVKTYQRKKRVQEVDSNPVLNINVIPTSLETESGASSVQSYAVNVEGSHVYSLVDVPKPRSPVSNERKNQLAELYKSPSYNPFQVPEALLKL